MLVATTTLKDENGAAPVGDEFGSHWCHEPVPEFDTGGL
jgi:hypothetical protein